LEEIKSNKSEIQLVSQRNGFLKHNVALSFFVIASLCSEGYNCKLLLVDNFKKATTLTKVRNVNAFRANFRLLCLHIRSGSSYQLSVK